MKSNKVNNVIGWVVFALSLVVYFLTLEPTVSLWDCGEFIATSWYLQIGHPPGAPFFLMLVRLAGLLAPSTDKVALFMNGFSAVASAATVMFLYWTIVRLAFRIGGFSEYKLPSYLAGIIGALSFAFTDTFWFSAVETEVYALSSLFTAVVFWAVLRWEAESCEAHADRWLLLIAYLIGLSIGVHLLNLLAIPAIVLMWYFKKNQKHTAKGIITSIACSFLIIAAIMWGIIQGTPIVAGKMEVAVVNGLGLPYNSGFILFFVLLFSLFVYLVWFSHKKRWIWLNAIALSAIFIYIGYGSYAMMMIRSAANPPIDENDPRNSYSLTRYLNREQYGKTPLISGCYFDAPAVGIEKGSPMYYPKNGRYELIDGDIKYIYDERFKTIFPRMYSASSQHRQGYVAWAGIEGKKKIVEDGEILVVPTFGENLRFFFNYQLGHMYFRYFMWNFSGRQNDIPGHGDAFGGNWITGIGFIDKANLGHNGFQPESMANSESTNRYFMLPLLLGLIGLFFHFNRKKTDFWVVALLFVMTGVAIVIYLNQTPYQPRERDYAYAGSFYAFSIWIGLGLLPIFEVLRSKLNPKYAAVLATAITSVVPVLLFAQNYDDHDRSGRFFVREMARNYLNSCSSNAILFTYADNDTFPLWYMQDVEKERRDVRVCNITLLGMDWYIDQMRNKVYDSDPLPIAYPKEKYEHNKRNVVLVKSYIERPLEVNSALKIVMSDDQYMLTTSSNAKYNYFPSRKLMINVDKGQVLKTGTVKPELASEIEDSIIINIKSNYLSKRDLAIIDIIANNNWERPIYFDLSVLQVLTIDLSPYLQFEGMACRFVPIRHETKAARPGRIDTDLLYDRLMNTFQWGGLGDPSILRDYNLKYTIEAIQLKMIYMRLAEMFVTEKNEEKCVEVLDRLYDILPLDLYSTTYIDMLNADLYYNANSTNKGDELLSRCAENCMKDINFYLQLTRYQNQGAKEIESNGDLLKKMIAIAEGAGRSELSGEIEDQLNALLADYE